MFKSSVMCFPFSFGTPAASGAWLDWIPLQFSTNISVLFTSYTCRSEQLEWLSLHTLWRADSWPFSFQSCLIWFWTIFSIYQFLFYGLCKFWCAFGIEMCFIFRRTVSGFVEHLFLNTRLTSKVLGAYLNSDPYSFLFLFFHSQMLQFFYCQGISALCSPTLAQKSP